MHSLIQRFAVPTCELGLITARSIHTTSAVFAGARFRESKGQPRHVNMTREFADAPDWSYLDGRPAPLGSGQRKRYLQQVEYNQAIQRMIHEVDTAKTAEAERIQKIAETKQQIIANKLRPKGKDLFSENNKYASQARKRPSLSRRVENN